MRFADLVDVEWPAAAQQFQDAHANRGSESPDNFELLLGIDVEKAADAFCLG